MLVIKNDVLTRIKDGAVFRVLLADAEHFAVCRIRFNAKTAKWDTDYGYTLPHPNMGYTLEELGYKKAKGRGVA